MNISGADASGSAIEEIPMNKFFRVLTVAAFGLTVGCVVIPNTFDANINVTIRHIEEQADGFLDYVEGTTDSLEGGDKTSFLRKSWNFVSPIQTAYAAETNQNSPRVKQIGAKMKERYSNVTAIKKSGAVGESNRGMLELVKPDAIGDAEKKNQIQRIIAAENGDRKALYNEIARLNKDQNLNVGQVEKIYAKQYIQRAKKGDLIQMPKAGPAFDAIKGSGLGKALGGKCTPGAWVAKP